MELENEIKKEIEFELEKQRVEETVKLIKQEIRSFIDKRADISNKLVEARKKAVEEYRDDEDKLIEYFDHERFVAEESFKAIDRRFKELNILKSSPYFGRVDFKEKAYDEDDKIYIGRFGFTPEDEYEPMVVDWRAPVSALFYAGKLGEASYEAPMGKVDVDIKRKRQFIIKKEELTGMFDSELEVKDEILQMVLSKHAGENLKDIIMTIQVEQDKIIRQPMDKAVIVDGAAGSGKTTIALHRVAYLLYNYRKTLQDKVLILGPNDIFMEYISTVLPSLGEIGVRQQTFTEFAKDILDLDSIMTIGEYMEKVISKDEEFINDMLYKTSEKFLDELDNFVKTLNDSYYKVEDLLFFGKVIVPKDAIRELFDYYKAMPLFRRSAKIKRILFLKIKNARDEKVREVEKWYKETLSKMDEESKNLNATSLLFKRKIKIREIIQEVIDAKKSLSWLNNESCTELYSKLNKGKKLTSDDLAPILYLKIKLEGLKLEDEIKHVVIDEAQDYSIIQFIVIKELTKAKGYTIVGDKNQRLIPCLGEIPMLKLKKVLDNAEYFNLNKSYRSTKEIMEYANKYLKDDKIVPVVREGKEVVEKSFSELSNLADQVRSTINDLKEKGYESIAVICRNIEETKELYSMLQNKVKIVDSDEVLYNKGEIILPSYFAKGLEFDAVIVVNYNNKEYEEDKAMYVMATRALHELYVYKLRA